MDPDCPGGRPSGDDAPGTPGVCRSLVVGSTEHPAGHAPVAALGTVLRGGPFRHDTRTRAARGFPAGGEGVDGEADRARGAQAAGGADRAPLRPRCASVRRRMLLRGGSSSQRSSSPGPSSPRPSSLRSSSRAACRLRAPSLAAFFADVFPAAPSSRPPFLRLRGRPLLPRLLRGARFEAEPPDLFPPPPDPMGWTSATPPSSLLPLGLPVGLLRRPDAVLQRRHQVDHLAAGPASAASSGYRLPASLRGDQLLDRLAVVVVERRPCRPRRGCPSGRPPGPVRRRGP